MTTKRLVASTALALVSGEDRERETSAEIIDVTDDGMTLIATDSPLGVVGRIDITDPSNSAPLDNGALGGAPTAVAVIGATACIGVNTRESQSDPSGRIVAMDLASGEIAGACDLGGQPD